MDIVTYDQDICIGCRYCMYACPFGVPNYEWDQQFPLVVKCDMCVSRLGEGQQPACAATCPTGAIKFGKYEDMLAEAHQRISDHPGKYIDHVYGEAENGGTATLYISPVPFEELGFPDAEDDLARLFEPAGDRRHADGRRGDAGRPVRRVPDDQALQEEAEQERLEAEQEQALAVAARRRRIIMLQKLWHELRTLPKFIYRAGGDHRASG